MIKFFIEMAYWAAYYMKWKSEKEIPFSSGVGYVIGMMILSLMIIMSLMQLYTPFHVVSNILDITPKGIFTRENKWHLVFSILPFGLLLQWFVTECIYRKISKKELFNYFKKMPLKRQAKGKVMFIVYSVVTVVVALFFATQVANQRASQITP